MKSVVFNRKKSHTQKEYGHIHTQRRQSCACALSCVSTACFTLCVHLTIDGHIHICEH